eukprot:g307.t1
MENGDLHETDLYESRGSDPNRLGHRHWIDRSELLRLIEQTLDALGYREIAKQLEVASEVKQEGNNVVSLRNSVLNGDWETAIDLLRQVPLTTEDQLKKAQFLVLEEKFLESLERQEWKTALEYLRSEITPLNIDTERVHRLAACFLCPTSDDLRSFAEWDGTSQTTRQKLLSTLQEIVPPNVMLPEGRLVQLLEQALEFQMNKSLFHNAFDVVPTLFADYVAGEEQIPRVVQHELWDHSDEVWNVEFSNDGKSLASCSRDGVTIIWQIHSHEEITKRLELHGHTEAVMYLSWSPDDQFLATTSRDKTLIIWEMEKGDRVRIIREHTEIVNCIRWLPDGQRFLSGSNDSTLCMWNLEGTKLKQLKTSRVQDLAISKDGSKVIIVGTDKKISVFDMETFEEIESVDCGINISAISLSRDGTKILASTQNRLIYLWEWNQEGHGVSQLTKPLRQYKLPDTGTNQQKYIIRACFGGWNEAFVLSGSEECVLYIWHKQSGRLIKELEGHSSTVNSVSWNPVDPSMCASASDDRSVIIWGATSKKSS